MSLLHHLWALICHHAGHRRACSDEAMASLTLYSTAGRKVRAALKEEE